MRFGLSPTRFKYDILGFGVGEAMATSVCPRCGAANVPGARFCSYCGATMAFPSPTPSPGAAPPGAYGVPAPSAPWALPPSSPASTSAEQAPTAAGVLSIIGGVFILLGGIIEAVLGSIVSSITLGAQGGVLTGLGILGALMGILILVFGILLLSHPDDNVTFGVMILVFSLISLVSFGGGFFIGFLLSLIGAILALTWKPYRAPTYVYQSPPAR